VVGVQADRLQQLDDALLALPRRLRQAVDLSASPMMAPTVMRGLSEA
jgi:hypothetical protein